MQVHGSDQVPVRRTVAKSFVRQSFSNPLCPLLKWTCAVPWKQGGVETASRRPALVLGHKKPVEPRVRTE